MLYNLTYFTVNITDFKKFMANKKITNLVEKVSILYYKFLGLFSKKASEVLSSYRPRIDYEIRLIYDNLE